MKNFSPALIDFLLTQNKCFRADLFTITLGNGGIIYATDGQLDIVAGGIKFYATKYGSWKRGTVKSNASFGLESNTMALSVVNGSEQDVLFPGAPIDTQLAADTFVRANENPLNPADWTTPPGGFSALQIVSDVVEASTLAAACFEAYTGVDFPNDQFCQMKVGAVVGVDDQIAAGVRTNGPLGYYADVGGPLGAGAVISLVANTTTGQNTLGTYTGTVATNDLILVAVAGSTLTVYQNGVLRITAQDANFASGLPGIGCSPNTVLADATIKGFIAGSTVTTAVTPLLQAMALGLFDKSNVFIQTAYMPSYGDTSLGLETKFQGQITGIDNAGRSIARFTVNDGLYLLALPFPVRLIQSPCNHVLYDAGCTLSQASFTNNYTVTGVSINKIITVASLAHASPYYVQGIFKFLSGANAGLTFTVIAQGSNTLTLTAATTFPVAIGDTFAVSAGCDKTTATCAGTFNNLIHIAAYPFVPSPETSV